MSAKHGLDALGTLFPQGPERIQKLLARAGYGSRRKCEEIILAGRVSVAGTVVRELGAKAAPESQKVEIDGRPLISEEPVYYLLNKPKGVLCGGDDPLDRKTVLAFFPSEKRRIFPVVRLDLEATGAVILTNDGRLTQLLTHPRYGIERTYEVRVRGTIDDYNLNRLRTGIQLSEGKTQAAEVWVLRRRAEETDLGMTIREGRNRQVRRMIAALGFKVRALVRKRIGAISLKGLGVGQARRLERREIEGLIEQAMEHAAKAPAPRKGPRGVKPKRHGKPDPKQPPNTRRAERAQSLDGLAAPRPPAKPPHAARSAKPRPRRTPQKMP